MFFSFNAKANSLLHPAAHIGMSYLFNDITYKTMYRLTNDKALSLLITVPCTFGVGILYKFIEDNGTLKYLKPNTVIYNTIGIGLSTTVIVINF